MTQTPTFSICVPSRNRQPYFQETMPTVIQRAVSESQAGDRRSVGPGDAELQEVAERFGTYTEYVDTSCA